MSLSATKLKVTLVLKPAELLAVPTPEGQARVVLQIKLPDRTVKADIATKSLRRAQAAIREAGADNVAIILQGTLATGDILTEAGLSAQPRTPKTQ
jgi:hypothetical protein